MKNKKFVLLILAVYLLSACSVFPNTGGNSLNGTSWKLTSLGKDGVIPKTGITLSFEDGQGSGDSGCNLYGGNYQVNGNEIKFEQIASTSMACLDPSVMEQESSYLQFLGEAQRFELADGQLQIYRSDGEALTFVPVQ